MNDKTVEALLFRNRKKIAAWLKRYVTLINRSMDASLYDWKSEDEIKTAFDERLDVSLFVDGMDV